MPDHILLVFGVFSYTINGNTVKVFFEDTSFLSYTAVLIFIKLSTTQVLEIFPVMHMKKTPVNTLYNKIYKSYHRTNV